MFRTGTTRQPAERTTQERLRVFIHPFVPERKVTDVEKGMEIRGMGEKREWYDRIILFLVCFYFLFNREITTLLILNVSCIVTVVALMIAYPAKKSVLCLSGIYLMLSIYVGATFMCMMPLIIHELAVSYIEKREHPYYVNSGLIVPCGALTIVIVAVCAPSLRDTYAVGIEVYLFVILGIISIVMAVEEKDAFERDRRIEQQEDMKRGMEILMAKHAKDSEREQEFEIHVATLKERNRIAREIHDNVGHSLSRAILLVGALETVNKDEQLKEPLSGLKGTLSDAMDNIRRSVHDLHDESMDLNNSITLLIRDFTFCPVKLDIDAGNGMKKEIKYCMVAIIKEALSNIAKHSNATHASVIIRTSERTYQLLIEDNGTASTNSDGTGIGLDNMRERIRALNGTVFFNSENGFRIFATIPREKI